MNPTKVIIGAGLYGLYAALYCARKGDNVIVLEYDKEPFQRATHNNQARVHMGYHYPRSAYTVLKSAGFFSRFEKEFSFCIKKDFTKIYAISSTLSHTTSDQFFKFCQLANIECVPMVSSKYFNENTCSGSFAVKEYTYDAIQLKQYFLKELSRHKNVKIMYSVRIQSIEQHEDHYLIAIKDQKTIKTSFVLNATYASINQILNKIKYNPFKIKYELCEIILCQADNNLKGVGITVMDGPFFSIMPFGNTNLYSLSSVLFTPHKTSHQSLPHFDCQQKSNGYCSSHQLGNCNGCIAKPKTNWAFMRQLTKKYLLDKFKFSYVNSLYAIKPILLDSEIDDSRPIIVKCFSKDPTFIGVLSGKINTVYEIEKFL